MNNPVSIEVGGSAAVFPAPRALRPAPSSQSVQVASLFMLPGMLASLTNSAIADSNGEYLYFYHSDHLGTPLFLTDTDGVVVWRGEYLPFGEVFSEDTDPDGDGTEVEQPFRFPGQYHDQETELYYNYFRDYDPQLGRYVEADPIGLAEIYNLYSYASMNPVNASDPLGLMPMWYADIGECSYYDDNCDPCNDEYPCLTKDCCEAFGRSPKSNCIRGCLINFDKKRCINLTGEARNLCRRQAHFECYWECGKWLGGLYYMMTGNVPEACKDAMESIDGLNLFKGLD